MWEILVSVCLQSCVCLAGMIWAPPGRLCPGPGPQLLLPSCPSRLPWGYGAGGHRDYSSSGPPLGLLWASCKLSLSGHTLHQQLNPVVSLLLPPHTATPPETLGLVGRCPCLKPGPGHTGPSCQVGEVQHSLSGTLPEVHILRIPTS